jgi:murein DD-endopeptidase MepM/ murein hydrolase activator NlpD
MFRRRRLLVSIVAIILALMIVIPLLLNAFLVGVSAATSDDLKKELDALQSEADSIAAKADEINSQIDANAAETASTVERKSLIDQQMEVTRLEIDNTQEQIQQYNLLIAAKQEELDEAVAAEAQMNETFKLRLRAMEENGTISYWAILFGASSFSDLLSRVDMISDIAQSDQQMLEQLAAATAQVEQARAELESEKTALQEVQATLAEQEAALEAQRAEEDALIVSLMSDAAALKETSEEYDALEADLLAQLEEINEAYDAALVREEEERRAAEAAAAATSSSSSSSGSTSTSSGSTSSSGYIYPLPSRVSITDAFGYRLHPTNGYYSFHYGVDFAASYGTTILAAKSGTVTSATYGEAYGYNVTILHSDGSYTLYAHMPGLTVSEGQYVTQGEVIGYVGSSGWSTGPHLHFGINIGGSWVNPMDYV